ncbi:Ppx/GppA phosphatase family protein [Zavarzinia sp. CC-PAN008]|uniref:Ppx/GppA phosphatase family protein n=1 Tax=Zavarzinia sp. CC-PAN008 TaxID=3243332 RepID=UPI003F7441A8
MSDPRIMIDDARGPVLGGGQPAGHAGAQPGRTIPLYAAIDLGTNNCRLLVAREGGVGSLRVVDAFSRIVRLGEGLAASGQLSQAAMDRTVDALAVIVCRLARRGVTHLRAVATEACRRAGNGPQFLERVQREAGLLLDVIPPAEEARLAVMGCAGLIDPSAREAMIFDIGGGSTELTWLSVRGSQIGVIAWTSVPLGVVTLAERHGGADLGPAGFARMVEEVRAALAPFEAENRLAQRVARGHFQMLGSSGTVTTLAGVHLGLRRYDRTRVDGTWIGGEDLRRVSHRLAHMTFAERSAEPCVGLDRADLVVAGCAILEAMLDLWPAPRLRVADRGLREGVILGLIQGQHRQASLQAAAQAQRAAQAMTAATPIGAAR